MIKRTIHFGNPAYLSLKNGQLMIDLPHLKELAGNDAKKSVPIEDIGVVLLDHSQITITHGCLEALLENNAAIIVCDKTHHPAGLLLPIEGHNTQSERHRSQMEASLPLKKKLWQQTVQAKIMNQAAVLAERGIETDNMFHWAKSVKSGDPDNYEGRAAAYYWRYVFSAKFKFIRDRVGEPPNNLLNYGYAILRAITARALVSSGLFPTLGIHHHNKYNAYCLADDIMEPYRPYVDQIVLQIVENGEDFSELTSSIKAQLLGIASVDVQFEKGRSPLMVGIQNTTASLAKCFAGPARKIAFPVMKSIGGKGLIKYKGFEDELPGMAAEEDVLYGEADDNEESYPF